MFIVSQETLSRYARLMKLGGYDEFVVNPDAGIDNELQLIKVVEFRDIFNVNLTLMSRTNEAVVELDDHINDGIPLFIGQLPPHIKADSNVQLTQWMKELAYTYLFHS